MFNYFIINLDLGNFKTRKSKQQTSVDEPLKNEFQRATETFWIKCVEEAVVQKELHCQSYHSTVLRCSVE